MTTKGKYQIIVFSVYFIALFMLVLVDWRIAVGILLFGTAMNIENGIIKKL